MFESVNGHWSKETYDIDRTALNMELRMHGALGLGADFTSDAQLLPQEQELIYRLQQDPSKQSPMKKTRRKRSHRKL